MDTQKKKINKVFCIGFNKTGTSTIDRIFQDLGMKSLHQGCGWTRIECPHYERFETEWWGDGNREIIDLYTAFSDGENHALERLDKMYPGSKFILNNRNLRKWLISRLKHRGKKFNRRLIEASILKRKEYYSYVFKYFKGRGTDFLVCNVAKDKNLLEKICRFLDMDVPEKFSIPVVNARDSRNYDMKKITSLADKVLKKVNHFPGRRKIV